MARSLAFDPSILLLDEPLSSLDKKLRGDMMNEILRIHNRTEVTTIHVTHNQQEALTMADRVAVINEGEIEQLSQSRELYRNPSSRFVADFIGNTNLLSGEITERHDQYYSVDTNGLDVGIPPVTSFSIGEQVDIGVRFENIRVGEMVSDCDNVYEGEIVQSRFKGFYNSYKIELPKTEAPINVIELNNSRGAFNEKGDEVRFGWDMSDSLIFHRGDRV